MGLMGTLLGAGPAQVGAAVGDLAEVFVGNRAERDAADAARGEAALAQYAQEFQRAPVGRFDAFMDGLNRLPRPLLVCGTLGLFAHAMIDPAGFGERMKGLALVPDPLWWLLGAIVSFYFGARELHYSRNRATVPARPAEPEATPQPLLGRALRAPAPTRPNKKPATRAPETKATDPRFNAAVEDWRATRR